MAERTAVLFDLDDTLYPERRFAVSACAAVALQVSADTGIAADALGRVLVARLRAGRRADLLQTACEASGLPQTEVPRLLEVVRRHVPRLRLPRESRDTLTRLRRDGHRLGVLTNGLPDTQRGKVAALGVGDLVDAVVYAEECAPGGKPAAACFETLLSRLEVEARAAVFVGDHPDKDVAGAAAVGLRAIWMVRHRPRDVDAAVGAHAVTRRLADLPPLVKRLLEDAHVAPC